MSNEPKSNQSTTPPQDQSLWPKAILPTRIKAPAAILKEQASFLGRQTQNVLVGEVFSTKSRDQNELSYAFVLVAPALNDYRLMLFKVDHEAVKIYPLVIVSEFLASPPRPFMKWVVPNEANFKNTLKIIFNHPKTLQAIQSLLAQSEGYTPPKEEDLPF
jgi:hypothetical protein